ncbi:hypothetical protein A0256_17660 [Mucilaginibacter sp. PAMC 26640]|nr:hypothetical protein A0256_17660 [Mucilaginibacter sp. PAMC 26640]
MDKHEAYLIHNKKKPPVKPAFVFLNTCSSGIVSDPDFADVLSDLYPAYALEIIITTFNIMDVHAGELPRAFYDNFIRQNKTAFDSFITAKNWLILGEKKYSAFGYLLWFARPDLRYSLKPSAII